MKTSNKPNENAGGRKDSPSGRQESDQPEHTGNAPSSLHQGQGPDFQTQDPSASQQNKGVEDMKKNIGFEQSGEDPGKDKDKKKGPASDEKTNPYEDPEHPQREEKPYIGDDPEEIKKKSPKMD